MNDIQVVNLELPWPPSVNNYKVVGRMVTTSNGKLYQQKKNSPETMKFYCDVHNLVLSLRLKGAFKGSDRVLGVSIGLHPPDNKRRDIDNGIKIILDSLQRAFLFEDDYYITRLFVERKDIIKNGLVVVMVYDIGAKENALA